MKKNITIILVIIMMTIMIGITNVYANEPKTELEEEKIISEQELKEVKESETESYLIDCLFESLISTGEELISTKYIKSFTCDLTDLEEIDSDIINSFFNSFIYIEELYLYGNFNNLDLS